MCAFTYCTTMELVHAELDAGTELEVVHSQQVNGSRHSGRHEAHARCEAQGHVRPSRLERTDVLRVSLSVLYLQLGGCVI
jgi:hypothetical protein